MALPPLYLSYGIRSTLKLDMRTNLLHSEHLERCRSGALEPWGRLEKSADASGLVNLTPIQLYWPSCLPDHARLILVHPIPLTEYR